MTFFQRNRQRYSQHRFPRRGGGYTAPQIVLHTYEAPITRSLTAAATWLTQRGDPGSYHALVGSRSSRDVLQLAPWSHETWHSTPNNNWSIGISAVAYAHQWNSITTAQRNNTVNSMAYAASLAAKWLQRTHGRTVRARVLTRAQAMRKESGFVTHATMDPGRRSDPGAGFPMQQFLREFTRLMSGGTSTPPQHIPEKGQAVMATPQQIWAYSNPDVDERQVYRMLRNMAEDAWGHRDLDYLNNNATTKNHQLARSAQRSHQIWQRIRQVAWRTWLATGIWNRRIAPEATVATQFPNIRKDGYRASTWQQYTYLQVRRAREEADQRAQRAEAKADKLELMIETLAHAEGEHIYEAVAAAMAEHDRRQVEVSVQVSAPEEQAADAAEAETDQVLDGDDDPKEEES